MAAEARTGWDPDGDPTMCWKCKRMLAKPRPPAPHDGRDKFDQYNDADENEFLDWVYTGSRRGEKP